MELRGQDERRTHGARWPRYLHRDLRDARRRFRPRLPLRGQDPDGPDQGYRHHELRPGEEGLHVLCRGIGVPRLHGHGEKRWHGLELGDGVENGRSNDEYRGHNYPDLTDVADVRDEDVDRWRQDLDSGHVGEIDEERNLSSRATRGVARPEDRHRRRASRE